MLNRRDTNYGQMQLWMEFWPEDPFALEPQLARIAEILDNPEFIEPFISSYQKAAQETGLNLTGRKTIPIRTFAGMMVLKHMHNLTYRELCEQVKDRISWRVFCRIPFGQKVPDYSTLCKLVQRFGPEAILDMNNALLRYLDRNKKLRGKKIKIDTTVIESNIEYPTDARVLKQGVSKISRLVTKCREAGVAAAKDFVDHCRSVRKHMLEIAKFSACRTGSAFKEIDQVTAKLAAIAEDTLQQAKRVLKAVRISFGRGSAKLNTKVVDELAETCVLLGKAISQAWQVASGNRHISDRLISFYDPGARPIRKGKPHTPAEFGRKVLLHSNEQHLITGYQVLNGNPSDDSLFCTALDQYEANTGYVPEEVAADRGVSTARNEEYALSHGVKRVSLPKRGYKSEARTAFEQQHWFRRLQRMRAGQEAEISLLKRRFGLNKSRSRGDNGTNAWVGWGVLSFNLCIAAKL